MFRSSPPIPHYDALVVGARCAGAATALLLARQGLRVLVIDRQGYGTDTLSTHALMRGAVLLLGRWGVLPDILEAGTPEIRRTVFHFGEQVLDIPIKPGAGVSALVAPRRTRLDRLLVDHARSAGAEIRFGAGFEGLLRRSDGRVVGAVVRDLEGRQTEIRCDVLIGADGLRSRVAQEVQAPVLRQARHSSAVVYGYHTGLDRDTYHWHYAPGASVGVIPTDDGQACVFAATSAVRARREHQSGVEERYHRLLEEAAPGLAGRMRPGEPRPRSFWGATGFMRLCHGPGWALVGDAGYFKDPLTSHGITDAFRDAELLAEAIRGGSEVALARYQAERDALSHELFEVTELIASFEWDMEAIQSHLNRLNAAMKTELAVIAGRASRGSDVQPLPATAA